MKAFTDVVLLLTRRPTFALTYVTTLAAGVGLTVGLFSVIDAILIRQLPFRDAGKVVTLFETSPVPEHPPSNVAPARIEDWKRRNRTFEAISGSYADAATDLSGREPERLSARRVMPDFFSVFGVAPIVGRTFVDEEERFGGPGAAVISEGLWTRRYGRAPSILQSALIIDGRTLPIVGVMPAAFAGSVDAWLPVQMPPTLASARQARFLAGLGRVKAGITVDEARLDLARVQRELGEEHPSTDRGWSVLLGDLKEAQVGEYRRPLLLLFGAVCLLLLIAVTNISGLVLAQLHRRRREFALRAAIGATPSRLLGLVVWEASILSACAAILGAFVALGFVELFVSEFSDVPRIGEVQLDWRALAVAVLAGALATVTCGVLPALRVCAGTTPLALLERRSVSPRHRLHTALIVAQVALGVLLLTTAGALLRSYFNLLQVDLGFNANNVVTFRVGAAWNEDRSRVGAIQEQVVARLQERSDVEAAGLTNFLPTTPATLRFQATVDGFAGSATDGTMTVGYRIVSAGYLQALQVPLMSGSWCPDLRANANVERTAMINRSFADAIAANGNVVGRHLRISQAGNLPVRIAGVVGDLVEDGHAAGPTPYVYACEPSGTWPAPVFVARTRTPEVLLREIRSLVRGVDAGRAVFGVSTLADILYSALDRPRLQAQMLMLFAAAALTLVALGVYGLFALVTAERTQEFGIRMALGATAGNVARMLLQHAAAVLLGGALAGLALSAMASTALSRLLFGVSPLDPGGVLAAVAVIVGVAVAAAAAPALRAVRADPVRTIRVD